MNQVPPLAGGDPLPREGVPLLAAGEPDCEDRQHESPRQPQTLRRCTSQLLGEP